MEVLSKSVLWLLPADIEGKEVLMVSSAPIEWRDLIDALQRVATLTLCTTTENVSPLTECKYIAPTDLAKDQFQNRFFAVLFFDPMSNELTLDILNKTSLSLLSDGGYVACVQSCNDRTTYDQTEVNYIEKCMKEAHLEGTEFCLEFVSGKLIIDSKHQNKAFYYTVQKKAVLESRNFIGTDSFQDVLTDQVYSTDVPQMYEALYGKTKFMSTGGSTDIEAEMDKLKVLPNDKILDVGSAVGGFSFLFAKNYGADVYGTELCMSLVDRSEKAVKEMKELKVNFEVCDVSLRNFPKASFDVIFSKDVILHIKDKDSLYKKFLSWLKPGGKLLIADLILCDDEPSDEFKAYMEIRKNSWYLLTLKAYEQCIKNAGFINATAKDVSYLLTNASKREYEEMKNKKETIIKQFGEELYNRWLVKLATRIRITQPGGYTWGIFYGEKPK